MKKKDFLDDAKEWIKKDKDLKHNHFTTDKNVQALLLEHESSESSFVQSVIKFAKEKGFITDKQFNALKKHKERDDSYDGLSADDLVDVSD